MLICPIISLLIFILPPMECRSLSSIVLVLLVKVKLVLILILYCTISVRTFVVMFQTLLLLPGHLQKEGGLLQYIYAVQQDNIYAVQQDNIYAVQQDTQSVFNEQVYSALMLARHVSDLTGPKHVELTYVLNKLTH